MQLYNMVNSLELPDFGGFFEIIEYMLGGFNDFWYFRLKNLSREDVHERRVILSSIQI